MFTFERHFAHFCYCDLVKRCLHARTCIAYL